MTSSVATFPDAPFAYGHPPSPATDASTVRIPFYNKKTLYLLGSFRNSPQSGCYLRAHFTSYMKQFIKNLLKRMLIFLQHIIWTKFGTFHKQDNDKIKSILIVVYNYHLDGNEYVC